MRLRFDDRFKKIASACLLSALTAGGISTLVSPVTADKAAVITISVNRTTKGDRLLLPPIAQPTRRDSDPTKRAFPEHRLLGCETAFGPLADATRGQLLTHCIA
jgi:hypothetical protein